MALAGVGSLGTANTGERHNTGAQTGNARSVQTSQPTAQQRNEGEEVSESTDVLETLFGDPDDSWMPTHELMKHFGNSTPTTEQILSACREGISWMDHRRKSDERVATD